MVLSGFLCSLAMLVAASPWWLLPDHMTNSTLTSASTSLFSGMSIGLALMSAVGLWWCSRDHFCPNGQTLTWFGRGRQRKYTYDQITDVRTSAWSCLLGLPLLPLVLIEVNGGEAAGLLSRKRFKDRPSRILHRLRRQLTDAGRGELVNTDRYLRLLTATRYRTRQVLITKRRWFLQLGWMLIPLVAAAGCGFIAEFPAAMEDVPVQMIPVLAFSLIGLCISMVLPLVWAILRARHNANYVRKPGRTTVRRDRAYDSRLRRRMNIAMVATVLVVVVVPALALREYWRPRVEAIKAVEASGGFVDCLPAELSLVAEQLRKMLPLPFVQLNLYQVDFEHVTVPDIRALGHVNDLTVNNSNIRDEQLAQLCEQVSVEALWAIGTNLTGEGLYPADKKAVRQLWLAKSQIDDAGMTNMAEMAHLEILQLVGTRITDAGMVHLRDLRELKQLVLSDTAISDAGMVYLKDLSNLSSLQLWGTSITDAALLHLAGMQNLIQLDLTNTQVTDAGIKHLAKLSQLRVLWLGGTTISSKATPALAKLRSLQSLYLPQTAITDEGLAAFAQHPTLYFLDLSDTNINEAGLEHLTKMPALYHVYLSGTKVTDAGMATLTRCPKLAGVGLGDTAVTEEGKRQLGNIRVQEESWR